MYKKQLINRQGIIFILLSMALISSLLLSNNVIAEKALRDPMQPATVVAAPEDSGEKGSEFSVNQIVLDKSPRARINGQVVGIDDVISGAKVIAIDTSSVTLLVDGVEKEIKLLPGVDKVTITKHNTKNK